MSAISSIPSGAQAQSASRAPATAASDAGGGAALERGGLAESEKARLRGKEGPARAIFTCHKSWSYVADAFGLEVVATVEPVPGIPPTARHLSELVSTAKARKVGVLIQEPYFSADAGKFLGREAGMRVVTAASSCDSPDAGSYLAHIQQVLAAIAGQVK